MKILTNLPEICIRIKVIQPVGGVVEFNSFVLLYSNHSQFFPGFLSEILQYNSPLIREYSEKVTGGSTTA